MCVIATGLKKDFETEWFDACCKSNPDGFFVARVNKNRYIRTLDVKKAREFFLNSAPEDTIVLHARIKSVGSVTAENIHGWKAEGLQFCHNGTLSIKASDGRTDSETFFKDLFLPVYRYNGCKFDYVTDRVINACISTSKFLIIRRRKVHLYGSYTTKGGCKFSNTFWDHSGYNSVFSGYSNSCSNTKPRTSFTPRPWFSSSAQTPLNKLYKYFHSRMVIRDAGWVVRELVKYAMKDKIPAHVPLVVLLDMYALFNNVTNHQIAAPDSYPYKVWLWRSLLSRDVAQVDEFIECLSNFFKAEDTVLNASTFYTFLSSTAHDFSKRYGDKIDKISDCSSKLKRLNENRDKIYDKEEWAKYTAGWTREYTEAFARAVSPLLTFKALRALVRLHTAAKQSRMDVNPSMAYIIRSTCLAFANELNFTAFSKLNDEIVTYINNLVSRLITVKQDSIGVVEDFWGGIGDLMEATTTSDYYDFADDGFNLPMQDVADDIVNTNQRTFDYSCISAYGDVANVYTNYVDESDDINLGFLNPPGKPNDKSVSMANANNQ